MEPVLYTGTDGSKTLFREDLNETYHSRHGAEPESLHVFIRNGLQFWFEQQHKSKLKILEMGFGTGLNAILTLIKNKEISCNIHYTALETLPLSYPLVSQLEYACVANEETEKLYHRMHTAEWSVPVEINEGFTLEKLPVSLLDYAPQDTFDLIYFDAFGPEVQPELWEESVFRKLYQAMSEGAVLVTYSSKGAVRRAMQECGFTVEKLEGPPRKRHMLRATKLKTI